MSEALNPLADLEAKLKGLEPLPAGLSRDRLLFEAGRRSARPSRLWPVSSALLGLACVALAGRLMLPANVERMEPPLAASRAVKPQPPAETARTPAAPPTAPERFSLAFLQDRLMKFGVDAPMDLGEGPRPVGAINVAARPLTLRELEAEQFPARPASAAAPWPAWLPMGGVR